MIYRVENIMTDQAYLNKEGKLSWSSNKLCDDPFELDWDTYKQLNDAGMIRYYTVRTDEGERVGFASFIISKMLHHKGKYQATADCIFIREGYKGTGKELLKLIVDDLKSEGVHWLSFNTNRLLDKSGNLAKSVDCTHAENSYQRSLV